MYIIDIPSILIDKCCMPSVTFVYFTRNHVPPVGFASKDRAIGQQEAGVGSHLTPLLALCIPVLPPASVTAWVASGLC